VGQEVADAACRSYGVIVEGIRRLPIAGEDRPRVPEKTSQDIYADEA
jgi:hypothetical protein